jgi:hypothetical protein
LIHKFVGKILQLRKEMVKWCNLEKQCMLSIVSRLKESVSLSFVLLAGISAEVTKLFRNGFPPDWKELLAPISSSLTSL